MAYDLTRCPQNESELQAYFYTLIGRALGTNADDWYQVMLKRYDWKGALMSIPRGVGPGIKQQPDAPFFGLTQQMGTEGNPQARIFMPTNIPDDLGYYTQQVQYIEDDPNRPGGFRWSWTHWNETHHPYAPVTGAEPVDPPIDPPVDPPEPPSGDLDARVERLEADVANLTAIAQQQHQQIQALTVLVSKAAQKGDPVDVRVGSNWGHGHAATGAIRT